MLTLLSVHLVLALLAPALVRAWGSRAFLVLAAAPAVALVWVLARLESVDATSSVTETVEWVPALDLSLALRLDPLAALLATLVTGVGALVLVYCARYFDADEPGLGSFAGVFVAFAGAMLGLVLADDLLLLYVFWELTTVFSYLLIGHSAAVKASRRAAMQALVVTTAGGLAMLAGIVMLGQSAGTYRLSEILADPPRGNVVTAAVVLLLVGALSKSAIFPLHFWLPAAMAAPTPVSAYLHAAAMVKAGIYLVARLAPGFADVPGWRPLVVGLGLATMLLGGWRALRQTDLKLLLAFGTVSQLGFLLVLVGAGTREAALAGVALIGAHGLFKATLFLVVGVIDRSTGTRDLRRLSGLGRRLPVLAGIGILGAASMAGLPPLAGFVAKEAAYDGFLADALPDATAGTVTLVGIVLGSVLTAAYSARFVWGAFATKTATKAATDATGSAPVVATPVAKAPGPLFLAAPALLAVAGLVAGPAAPLLDPALAAYADALPSVEAKPYHLALWHGPTVALGLTALTFAAAALVHLWRGGVEGLQARLGGHGDADMTYRRLMRRLDRGAATVTGGTQRGSLPVYLGTILVVLIVLAGGAAVVGADWPEKWRLWDAPLQLLVGSLVVACAVAATRVKQRVAAVLLVGMSGYGVGVLFALHGAPDLVMTQMLVETITLVVFVLVLRKLPKTITERHTRRQRALRLLIAVPAGLLMAGLAAMAIGARAEPPISTAFPERAYEFGGGKNVVNVTLVDIRAWDTIGETSVLIVAATGVASLVFLRRRGGGVLRPDDALEREGDTAAPEVGGGMRRGAAAVAGAPDPRGPMNRRPVVAPSWLRSSPLLRPERRSVILEGVTRTIFYPVMLLSIYLLFAGHNVPGGGFAGGLVAGLALVLRYLAGGRYELGVAAPVDAGLLLGLGLAVAGSTGVGGLLLGADVLQTAIVEGELPIFGPVKLVTSLFFDIGVYLIVVGLVLDVLRSLGAEIDRQAARA